MYKNGEGLPQDDEEAMKNLMLAEKGDDGNAEYQLALLVLKYQSGKLPPYLPYLYHQGLATSTQRYDAVEEALYYFREAAEKGHAEAQEALRTLVFREAAEKKDAEERKIWGVPRGASKREAAEKIEAGRQKIWGLLMAQHKARTNK